MRGSIRVRGFFLIVFLTPFPSANLTADFSNGFTKACNLCGGIKARRFLARRGRRSDQFARSKFSLGHKAANGVGTASVYIALYEGIVHGLLGSKKLLYRGWIKAGNTAAGEALTRVLWQYAAASACKAAVGHVATVGSIFGRLVVIDGLVAGSKAHSIRVVLLDLLGDQADLGARITLVVVAVDCLAIKRLANSLDVFLQTFVGEETTRLCFCC